MPPFPRLKLHSAVALAAALLCALMLCSSSLASAGSSCSLYAAPSGSDSGGDGSLGSPFASPQRLMDALGAGQTGCLLGGTYDLSGGGSGSQLRVNHGGSAGAPITLTSAPGQTATLVGGPVYIPVGSDYVTLTDLHINAHGVSEIGVQIMGAYDQLTNSDVTNQNSQGSCIILGYSQPASHTLIAGNVIHECGHNSNRNEDHGVYVDYSVDATIKNNVFWGIPDGWGVQLYPQASGTQVVHNVIDDNGHGVVFAGDGSSASNDNVVAYNIISNSNYAYNIQSWWGGPVGSGNLAKSNCLYNGASGNVMSPSGFSTANNVVGNPQYNNPSAHDYTLGANSPCRAVVGYDTAALIQNGAGATVAGGNHHHGRHRYRHHRRHHRRRHGGHRRRRHHRSSEGLRSGPF